MEESRPGFGAGNSKEPSFVEAWSPIKCGRAASGGAGLCECGWAAQTWLKGLWPGFARMGLEKEARPFRNGAGVGGRVFWTGIVAV